MDASERINYVQEIKDEIKALIISQKTHPSEYKAFRIKELATRLGLKESDLNEMVSE